MTLSQRLNKIEKQLEKVSGCSPLTHGWQTQKLAKAQRKWDELAKEKQRLLKLIEEESASDQVERKQNTKLKQ